MEKYRNGYVFDLAKEEDIKGIMEIELKYFESLAYKEEDIIKWMQHNNEMFYVVKDAENKVIAFTIIAPITKNCYNKFKNGIVKDMNEFNLSDIETTMESDYYYFADVVSDKKNSIAAMIIFKHILPILWEKPKYIVTTPVTNSGKNKALKLKAKNLNGNSNLELEEPCYINVKEATETAMEMVETIKKVLARK